MTDNKSGIFKRYINEYKAKRKRRKERDEYLRVRRKMRSSGIHSELMIDRPDGQDRCSLILTSYDTPQLKQLQAMLRKRNVESELLEGFEGGQTMFKFELMPRDNSSLNIVKDFDNKLRFLDEYFMYGQPVKDISFFKDEERALLEKWYK